MKTNLQQKKKRLSTLGLIYYWIFMCILCLRVCVCVAILKCSSIDENYSIWNVDVDIWNRPRARFTNWSWFFLFDNFHSVFVIIRYCCLFLIVQYTVSISMLNVGDTRKFSKYQNCLLLLSTSALYSTHNFLHFFRIHCVWLTFKIQ